MTTDQTTKPAKAIEKELAKLEKQVEGFGWPTKGGEPILTGQLQEIPGVGTVFHRRGPGSESELIEPDRLDLTQRHHVVYELRRLRAELASARQAAERERRKQNRERLDGQADARRKAACKAAGISEEFVDEVKAALAIIDDGQYWPRSF